MIKVKARLSQGPALGSTTASLSPEADHHQVYIELVISLGKRPSVVVNASILSITNRCFETRALVRIRCFGIRLQQPRF